MGNGRMRFSEALAQRLLAGTRIGQPIEDLSASTVGRRLRIAFDQLTLEMRPFGFERGNALREVFVPDPQPFALTLQICHLRGQVIGTVPVVDGRS